MNLDLTSIYASYARERGIDVRDMDVYDEKEAITAYILVLKNALFDGKDEKIRRERKEQVDD